MAENPTLKEVVTELQDKILEKHGKDVGYKIHAQDGEAGISLEVFVPRGNGGHVPEPREKLTAEELQSRIQDSGWSEYLKAEVTVAGVLEVKKLKLIPDDVYKLVQESMRSWGLKWIPFIKEKKESTGLWRHDL